MNDTTLQPETKPEPQSSTQAPYKQKSSWMRALYMLLFSVIYGITEFVLFAVIILQLGFVLITGQKNDQLLELGGRLSQYVYQILQYLNFNQEGRPFPWADFPETQKK